MILLDTNVVSEPLRRAPKPCVIAWIDKQPLETLYLSVITVAELRAGVALLPPSWRRAALHENLENRVLPMFAGRVLPFDLACTIAYAELMVTARTPGSRIKAVDACVAAVALSTGLTFATRNIHPFQAAGLRVINPWE